MDVDKELLDYMHHIPEDSTFTETTTQTLHFRILDVINYVTWSSCQHTNQYSKFPGLVSTATINTTNKNNKKHMILLIKNICQQTDNQSYEDRVKANSQNIVCMKYVSDNGQCQRKLMCNESIITYL
jgi:hypothetical protein